jgi:hypothetical protein
VIRTLADRNMTRVLNVNTRLAEKARLPLWTETSKDGGGGAHQALPHWGGAGPGPLVTRNHCRHTGWAGGEAGVGP